MNEYQAKFDGESKNQVGIKKFKLSNISWMKEKENTF